MADPRATPIRFGLGNDVVDAELTATPTPATPIEWLKSERRARQVLWPNPAAPIVIDGQMPGVRAADFVAIPGSSLTGIDQYRLQLYSDEVGGREVFDSGDEELTEIPPIGEWRAGIDPYGVPIDISRPDTFVAWLPETVVYRAFRLTVTRSDYSSSTEALSIRMLVIGQKLELEHNFTYGHSIRFLTEPQLLRTSSGRYVPARRQRPSRSWSMSLPAMTELDRERLWEMEVSLAGAPFLLSAFPDRRGFYFGNYTFLGRFAASLDYGHRFEGMHESAMTIVEV